MRDIKCIFEEVSQSKYLKVSSLQSLCPSKIIHRDKNKLKLQKKVAERYEKHLDIQNLVNMRKNLDLLLHLLLSKEQMLLFKHNIAHSIGKKVSKAKKKDSDFGAGKKVS